jgi:hypothetical protein
MSKTTLRKRIAITVVTALTTGVLSAVVTAPVANAHNTIVSDGATAVATTPSGTLQGSMFVATRLSTSGVAVLATDRSGSGLTDARSIGLLTKDASSGTAQTATMLASGVLSLYVPIAASTTVAFVATGGTFNVSSPSAIPSATYAQDRRTILMGTGGGATTLTAAAWTAPSAAGTYTISMYNSAAGAPTLASPANSLGAQITVTVVSASAGGSYSAAYSYCRVSNASSHFHVTDNVDSTAATTNGNPMFINLALNDAYGNDLDSGNLVVTATNSALVAVSSTATPTAGTGSTVVAYTAGAGTTVRVNQATANTPISTTVTITYNGTTVCTKTVGIAGEVAKLTVVVTDTQDLSSGTGKANFLDDGWHVSAGGAARAGHFTVLATDAGGNQVATSAIGTFAVNAASLAGQTIVTALAVDSSATVSSSTSPGRLSTGTYTCGATAGEVKTAKIDFTNTGSGKVITSDAFTVRCADDPYSYTASFDKASYVQGDLATLTVKFLDSKGNPANSTSDTGSWTGVTPMLTAVSATGAAGGLDKNGVKTFTYTVGTASGMTAGTYTSVIDWTALTGAGTAVKATPTYKLSTASADTSFTEVLKSVVALIASINKQIQALQKLILKR